MIKKKLILMITPSMVGGSWIALKQLAEIPDKRFRYIVLGLGNYKMKHKNFKIINIPYFRYDSYAGYLVAKYTIIGLIYQMPLYLISFIFILLLRPKIIIFNSLATLLPLLPIAKPVRSKTVLSYRSWFDVKRHGKLRNFLQFCGKFIDLSFVNSTGTEQNLSILFPKEKILIIEHNANRIFFQQRDRDQLRQKWSVNKKFVVLYVGRIDEEKHCPFIFELIRKLKNRKDILFLFVGEGLLKNKLIKLMKECGNIRYLGFFADIYKLAEIYSIADVLWSYADETYLARPALESLASGTPIIIPSIPAMGEKIIKNVRISKSLIPQKIGWVIDIDNHQSIVDFLIDIKESKSASQKREECFEYAKLHYFEDNNLLLLERLDKLVNQ